MTAEIKSTKLIIKHPNAEKKVNFDLSDSNELAAGEALTAVTDVAVTPGGALTAEGPLISGLIVQLTLKGGVVDTTYEVQITVTTDQSQTLVYCGLVSVENC